MQPLWVQPWVGFYHLLFFQTHFHVLKSFIYLTLFLASEQSCILIDYNSLYHFPNFFWQGGGDLHLRNIQKKMSIPSETLVNLFVYISVFFFPPFGFPWRLFLRMELPGQTILWLLLDSLAAFYKSHLPSSFNDRYPCPVWGQPHATFGTSSPYNHRKPGSLGSHCFYLQFCILSKSFSIPSL